VWRKQWSALSRRSKRKGNFSYNSAKNDRVAVPNYSYVDEAPDPTEGRQNDAAQTHISL
jgi:hypothetical protein